MDFPCGRGCTDIPCEPRTKVTLVATTRPTALATLAALMLFLMAGPATADARIIPSGEPPWDVPARFDIKRVKVINGDEQLRYIVRMKRTQKKGVVVFARWHMTGDPGWVFEAESFWRKKQKQKVFRLFVWPNTESRTRVDCPEMSARWSLGTPGHVTFTFPSDCINGPRTWERFDVFTAPKSTGEAADWADSQAPLEAG